MNKLCYRIVFNKSRGMCMVVQETAHSRSKGPGVGAAGRTASNVRHLPALRRLALLLGVGLCGTGFAGGVMAQIVADPHAPGQQRATVLNAANGVLQVNIQTPSEAGVSRNVYSQFDVPKSGAILNNSRTSVQSQLGGWVQGNPWLATGTARVILNEVNSSNPSRLQGYIEVAGARAETIIANPAGIVVDGGGFINVSRATLTTGSPVFEDGRVKGYSVQRGQIVIDGAGLDASKTDYTALIARSLQVNAGMWAQRLNIVTGVNEVAEGEQAKVTQSAQASATAPAYAVDVARLGGMYAGQIYLVGTEAGVGVHNAGAIGASVGDLVVTAAGRLENGGVLSATGNLKVDASAIDNHGRAQAGGTLALNAGSMVNAGLLTGGREASIAIQGEIDNSHGRIEARRIDLTGASLRNAQGSIVQSGSQALAIDAADVINTAGVIGRQSGVTATGSAPAVDTGASTDGTATALAQGGTTAPDAGSPPAPAVPALADGRVQVGTLDNAAGVIASNGATLLRSAGSANLMAGRDVRFDTLKTGSTYRSQIDGVTEKDSTVTHRVSQISTTGDLRMTATGNLKLNGTQVAIGTTGEGSGQLLAGGSVAIASVINEIDTSVSNDPHSKRYDKQVHENQSVVGADVSANGSLTVAAGLLQTGALTVTGSSLTAGDALKLTASDSVSMIAAQENHLSDTALGRSSHSLLKSKTTQQADYVASTDAVGSALSGKTVEVNAGRDINVLGSGIAGDVGVRLLANGSVNIEAATRTVTEQHHRQVKESGFLSGGGFGFSIGTRTTTTDQSRDATTQSGQSRSVVGAVHGNLDIVAGDAIKIGGSDLAAGSDMTLDGRSVVINAGQDDTKNAFKQTTVQNGLSFAVGGSVVNAIQTTQRMSSAAAQAKDARFKALSAAAAIETVNDAVDDLAKNGPSVRISVTAGHSESESTQVTTASTHTGSALTAGGNVTISATDGGKGSNLNIIGSEVRGVGSVALIADNDINVLAAHDTDSQHSKSRSTSAALGVAANIGTSGMKVGVTASASASRGNVDGDGMTQIDSHVIAGEQLTIASGANTNLRGAVVSGRQVVADIKGNLNIESLQDTARLDGKRQSASAAGTLGAGAGVSASASVSQVHNDFASVAEQSGIRAGEGGFQIQVAGTTDLKGGVISSSDAAIKDGWNSLVTGSLSYKDIQNHDRTEASGISLGGNVAENQNGGTFSPGMAPGIGHVSGEQSSVTRSGISGGELKVADRPGDVAGLNRDVTTGKDRAQALVKAWNGAKALDEVGAQMEITSAAMPRLAKEIGDYAENKIVEMKEQGNLEEAAKWEEGGVYRVAAHAALGAMGGGVGGALGAAAAAEAAPTITELESAARKKLEDAGLTPTSASLIAKALVGGTVTAVGSVVGGSVGASAAINADVNNRQLHQREYDFAKKYAKLVAEKLGVTKEDAEGRIVAEILRNSDKVAATASGDKHDYEVRALLGCQNLNCSGYLTDAKFADHNFNREFIGPNLEAYYHGKEMMQKGMTASELEASNVKKDPVGVTFAGAGLIGLGYISGGAGTAVGMKMFGAGVGAFANYVFQPSGQKDWIDVGLAGVTGFVTSGAGLISSGVTNVGGSIIGSGIKGENPNPGIYGAGVGTVGGYVVGKAIEGPLGRVFDSRDLFSPDWIDMGHGVSRWNSSSPIPGLVAGVGASFAQEPIGNKAKDFIQAKKDEIKSNYFGH